MDTETLIKELHPESPLNATASPWWLSPSPLVLVLSALAAVLIPLFLHLVIYRSGASSTLPTFLLVGPSGSGKTALLTLIERGKSATTCTSSAPRTVEASVPVEFEVASNRYRSVNDPSAAIHKKFLLTDTPGHGKLRHFAFGAIRSSGGGSSTSPKSATSSSSVASNAILSGNLRGIMFVVDATALAPDSSELRDVAGYLHDVLLDLQIARSKTSSSSKADFPVLVVVNKLDLFTALPADMARQALEQEISKIRVSKSKGVLDAGVDSDGIDGGEREWLGAGGEGGFEFGQMEDAGVEVTVEGSRTLGQDGDMIEGLWTWMGNQL